MSITEAYRALAKYDQWLVYNEKKQPLNPHDGKPARWAKEPDKCLVSYTEAVQAVQKNPQMFKGLVFVLTEHDPFAFIDCDDVVEQPDTPDGTPLVDPYAARIVHLLDSYTEYSRSGRGYHILVEADVETLVSMPYVDCVEIYSKGRCIVMTNKHVPGTPYTIEQRQAHTDQLVTETKSNRKDARRPVNRLKRQIEELKHAVEGERNTTLNDTGFMAGQCMERVELREKRILKDILAACHDIGLLEPEEEAKTQITLENAIRAGREKSQTPLKNRSKHRTKDTAEHQKVEIHLEGALDYELDEMVDALVAANSPPELFTRSGKLARIRTDEKTNTPIAEEISDGMLDVRLARTIQFLKFSERAQDWVATYPPTRHIRDIMQLEKNPFPALAGISQMPILHPDYTVFAAPGYDEINHMYFWPQPGLKLKPLPELTQENGRMAAQRVSDYIMELPFVAQVDYANTFATLLSTVTRSLVDMMPMAVISAAIGGTGKSLIAAIVSLLMCGRLTANIPYPAGDEDEMRKKLTAAMMKGLVGPLAFDNVPDGHYMHSTILEGFLGNLYWSDRVLGTSNSPDLEQRSLVLATGNNIDVKGMLKRRYYPIHLDAGMSKPWTRTGPTDNATWKYPNLLYTVLDRRADIWVDLMTMVLAWHVDGERTIPLPTNDTLYLEWIRITTGVLAFCGVEGFYTHLDAQEDIESGQWSAWLGYWFDNHTAMTARSLISTMTHDTKFADLLPDTLVFGFRDEKKRDTTYATTLGRILGTKANTPFGQRQLCVVRLANHDPATWAVIERKRTVSTITLQTPAKDRVDRVDNGEVSESNTKNANLDNANCENAIFPINSDSEKLSTLSTLTTLTFLPDQENGQETPETEPVKQTPKTLIEEMDELIAQDKVEVQKALAKLGVDDEE